MRLIDADELIEHAWRDKLDSRELIAEMIEKAPTIKEISIKIPIAEVKTQFIPKADYEARLKADMVSMLTEILLEIEQCGVEDSHWIIKEKINALTKGDKDE